ncbi:hypothetical protein AV521_12070 [Streptomyces sp. IMTB 2501]|nr:hypothetical protein AV521_12070 [Streptomyces sp. IMTB 2501]
MTALLALPASAQGAEDRVNAPVGSWEATVTRPGATDYVQMFFTRSGRACLISDGGTSLGSWVPTGPNAFNYRIKEALSDGHGTQTGWVYINQYAAQTSSNQFDSSGISTIYDLSGNKQGAVTAKVVATRGTATPPAYCSR